MPMAPRFRHLVQARPGGDRRAEFAHRLAKMVPGRLAGHAKGRRRRDWRIHDGADDKPSGLVGGVCPLESGQSKAPRALAVLVTRDGVISHCRIAGDLYQPTRPLTDARPPSSLFRQVGTPPSHGIDATRIPAV